MPATPQQVAPVSIVRSCGHERQQVERRLADAVALLLARRVVDHGLGHRLEVRVELAALVHREQVLADVEDAPGHDLQVRVVRHAEDLERLALEHQAAARGRRDDVDALAGVRGEPGRQPVDVAAGVVEQCRWTAAAGRSSPAWAPRPRARCARAARPSSRRAAARSSWCRSRGRRRRGARRAGGAARRRAQRWNVRPAKRGIGARWWMPIAFSIASRSSRLREAPVGERRHRGPEPARQRRAGQDPVTQLDPLGGLQLRRGPGC